MGIRSSENENLDYYYYLRLLLQEERVGKFQQAIHSLVSNKKVVEVGTGLGTYSLFAASRAEVVYALEKGDIIKAAEKLARINQLNHKIVFIQGHSLEVTLPERCHVLIVEDFSSLFLRRDLEEVIKDARTRMLREDAICIPGSVSLFAVPVQAEMAWKKSCFFDESETQKYGLDFGLLRRMMLSNPHVMRIAEEDLLGKPRNFLNLDLLGSESFLFDEVMEFRTNRNGEVFGVAAWFDLNLTDSLILSNAPSSQGSTWGQVFFPVICPLPVRVNDPIRLRLACSRSQGTRDLWWTWQMTLPSGTVDQSTFKGIAFWPGEAE